MYFFLCTNVCTGVYIVHVWADALCTLCTHEAVSARKHHEQLELALYILLLLPYRVHEALTVYSRLSEVLVES